MDNGQLTIRDSEVEGGEPAMSERVFGEASEFYRLRTVRVDDADAPDLEWREDILYREPPVQAIEEFAVYRVEIVSVLTDDVVNSLGEYTTEAEALLAMDAASADLDEMTKAAFDGRYVEPGQDG